MVQLPKNDSLHLPQQTNLSLPLHNTEYFGIRLVNALLLLRAELTDTYRVIYSCSQTVPIVTGLVGEALKSLHRVLLSSKQAVVAEWRADWLSLVSQNNRRLVFLTSDLTNNP